MLRRLEARQPSLVVEQRFVLPKNVRETQLEQQIAAGDRLAAMATQTALRGITDILFPEDVRVWSARNVIGTLNGDAEIDAIVYQSITLDAGHHLFGTQPPEYALSRSNRELAAAAAAQVGCYAFHGADVTWRTPDGDLQIVFFKNTQEPSDFLRTVASLESAGYVWEGIKPHYPLPDLIHFDNGPFIEQYLAVQRERSV